MAGKLFLITACLIGSTSAFWFFGKSPDWNGLRVKFGIPLFSNAFDDMPRTVGAAIEAHWTQLSSNCSGDPRQPFLGHRYILEGDRAVILLFDSQGYIAGIQTSFPTSTSDVYPPRNQIPNFFQVENDGTDNYYTLTAYFVNPELICREGRTEENYQKQGTGTELYIQRGPDPMRDVELMPKTQSEVDQTAFTKGECFRLMGVHYWYNITEDMSCDDFQPFFLLYNKGKLNAFGWAMGVGLSSSRYEHPQFNAINKFMKPVAQCLKNYPQLSTMHIYMTDSFLDNLC